MLQYLTRINQIAWGPGTLILFAGTGIFFLFVLKGRPWKKLIYALKLLFRPEITAKGQGMTSFQSAMTALGACMGTGNIAGVASAMVLGGPGALVWMCLSAMLGLPVIFSECILSIAYRKKYHGRYIGGPMYVMREGIGGRVGAVMAFAFAVMTMGASFGVGNMTQSNSAGAALAFLWHIPAVLTGLGLMIALVLVFLMGQGGAGRVSAVLVPTASVGYLLCAVIVIVIHHARIGHGIYEMFQMAFSLKAVSGGIGGAITVSAYDAMRWGVARGIFSNEAGLGSAPIAASGATGLKSTDQAYLHMAGAFFDTVIMCSVTGLAIAASGVLGMTDDAGRMLDGVQLTMQAFSCIPGDGGLWVIGLGMLFFAFSTLIGWAYYGENALLYLTSSIKARMIYRVLFCIACFAGAVYELQTVWLFSDIMNVCMALPNLICLWLMWREIKALAM